MGRSVGRVTYDNQGRIVLVSGGVSGIGQAICDAFAQSGAIVICLDIAEPCTDVPLSDGVEYLRGDVGSDDDCRRAVDHAVETHGGLDVLVNNAAIQPVEAYRPVDELPIEIWDRIVRINFTGYTLLARHALSVMKKQQSGVVVNIASAQAHRTARGVGAYGPIKAANVLQSRQWGVEYAREGIRVVSVSPGAIDTPLVQASAEAQGGEAELANRHPLGRIGRPNEVAQAVVWLASGDASFVTGADLEVDGGLGAFAAFADPYPM
ncbi:MAG: SDR family oxidoreductase [Fuerstiella sp.]|nr:SDR family oxidoreductase [Fuerstiella sp.]